ncbi:MAG: hypothetical protein RIG84_12795 [Roseovarius sp.]
MGAKDDGALRELSLLMLELRRQFAGDLDRALIILVLLTAGSQAAKTRSATAIARVTGIPRESVRRKLNRMRSASLVDLEADGRWRVSGNLRETLHMLIAASAPPRLAANIGTSVDRDRSNRPGEAGI